MPRHSPGRQPGFQRCGITSPPLAVKIILPLPLDSPERSDWSRTIYARGRDEDYVILTRGAALLLLWGLWLLWGLLMNSAAAAAAAAVATAMVPLACCCFSASVLQLPCAGHHPNNFWFSLTHFRFSSAAGRLLDRIRVLLAGRAAEEIMLGSPSTYSNADLKVRM